MKRGDCSQFAFRFAVPLLFSSLLLFSCLPSVPRLENKPLQERETLEKMVVVNSSEKPTPPDYFPRDFLPPNSPLASACLPKEKLVFSKDVTDLESVSQITPPGFMLSTGQLKTHSYLWIKDNGDSSGEVPVSVPADAKLISGAYYSEGGISQYLLFFEVACQTEIKFDHVRNPIDAIKKVFPNNPQIEDTHTSSPSTALTFNAGDLIGHTPGNPNSHNWDFGMYDRSKENIYKTDPHVSGYDKAYGNDFYAICPYDFFLPKMKSKYVTLFNGKGELCE